MAGERFHTGTELFWLVAVLVGVTLAWILAGR